jgi:hypothetical protein
MNGAGFADVNILVDLAVMFLLKNKIKHKTTLKGQNSIKNDLLFI